MGLGFVAFAFVTAVLADEVRPRVDPALFAACSEAAEKSLMDGLFEAGHLLTQIYFPSRGSSGELGWMKQRLFPAALPELRFSPFSRGGALAAEIQAHLATVMRVYGQRETVSAAARASMVDLERSLVAERTSWIIFSDRLERTRFTLRVYDGSRVVRPYDGWSLPEKDSVPQIFRTELPPLLTHEVPAKLPVELEYPELRLPADEWRFEVGRGARDSELPELGAEANNYTLRRMFRTLGLDLHFWPANAMIYASCTGDTLGWYVREHGFEVVASSVPSHLGRDASSVFTLDDGREIAVPAQAVPAGLQRIHGNAREKPRFIIRISGRGMANVASFSRSVRDYATLRRFWDLSFAEARAEVIRRGSE